MKWMEEANRIHFLILVLGLRKSILKFGLKVCISFPYEQIDVGKFKICKYL